MQHTAYSEDKYKSRFNNKKRGLTFGAFKNNSFNEFHFSTSFDSSTFILFKNYSNVLQKLKTLIGTMSSTELL